MSTTTQLSAGRELDAAVAKAMVIEPRVNWKLHTEGDSVFSFWSTEREAREQAAHEYAWLRNARVTKCEHYHPYSTDPAACSLVKKWLRENAMVLVVEWERFASPEFAYRAEVDGVGEDEESFGEYGSTEEEAVSRLVLRVAEAM